MLRTTRMLIGGLAVAFALSLHASELARAEAADTAAADDLPSKPTKDDVPTLIKKLRDKDPFIRMKAAKLLGGLGADAKDALPELSKLLSDPDIDVRSVASNAMNKIQTALDNKQTLDDLQKKLNTAVADKNAIQTQLTAAQKAQKTQQDALTAAQKAQQDAQTKLGQKDQHIAEQNATIAKLKTQLAKKK